MTTGALGGILEGKDRKGRDWQPCPVGYIGAAAQKDSDDDEFTDADDDRDYGSEPENSEIKKKVSLTSPVHNLYTAMPEARDTELASGTGSLFTPVSSAHSLFTTVSGLQSRPRMSTTETVSSGQQAVSNVHSLPSSLSTLTVSTVQQAPIFSTSPDSPFGDDRAELEQLRRQCQALENQSREQARLLEEQHASAERMELKRQVQVEKERLESLTRSSMSATMGQNQSSVGAHLVNNLRQQSNIEQASSDFPNFYQGPNIKEIRRTKGLRSNAEKVVESIRSDVASIGRRPTASHLDGSLGARTKNQPAHQHKTTFHHPKSKEQQEYREFMEFKAWKERNAVVVADSDSGSDASPPGASHMRQSGSNRRALDDDPPTDPSSCEDESGQPVVLVYRRDKNGLKYRSYEPYHADAGTVSRDKPVKYAWVTDPVSGREYKREVPANKPSDKSSKQSVSGSGLHSTRRVDHRSAQETPETGHRRGMRSPSHSQQHVGERVPGIVPLQDKEGKSDDRRTPTITDWAKNCPVAYAEKIKYDEINLPIWVWAYVSEILSSRSGLSPDMPRGELEARLQHLLCVLQVALVNSEKTDFSSKGWSIASIYAKRVQQKLDRGLETWEDFKRFGYDPHPSEMFTAKTEVDKRVPNRKKKEDDKQAGTAKRLCTTWNNCEVERKCQYLVDYPSATKCNKRHDCSYCQEKGYGTFNHQRRFCKKRREAGDE